MSEVVQAFRVRVDAVVDVVTSSVDPSAMARALSASSDIDAVLMTLGDPHVLFELSKRERDPLADARKRGIVAMRELMNSEGGSLSVGEVAELCGITPQAVNKRREAGTLLGVRLSRRDYFYPAWQFDDRGAVLTGLAAVLSQLKVTDPWLKLSFFLTGDARLDGRTPLAALREGDVELAKAAADLFCEHGAT